MKQKLGIIQAIMENQNLLVLDEPFNALDEKSVWYPAPPRRHPWGPWAADPDVVLS